MTTKYKAYITRTRFIPMLWAIKNEKNYYNLASCYFIIDEPCSHLLLSKKQN